VNYVEETLIVELHVFLPWWLHGCQLWGWLWRLCFIAVSKQCHVLAAVWSRASWL